jgi:hypothetical protein
LDPRGIPINRCRRSYACNVQLGYFSFRHVLTSGPVQQQDITKEGTLVVDLFDAKTKPLIWRGRSADMLSTKAEKKEPGKGHLIFCYFPAHRCGVMR